ncbi:hypothetical protein FJY94_03055 [Candidatus Kaiserbacteria bacterium]|nr:hypothetical protein [Candidatus Kaiserbacteria bacterium]
MNIPVEKYLAHALSFTPQEMRLQYEFEAWLPDEIIDCHAHCNLREHVAYVSNRALAHMLSTFTYYSIEDSLRVRALLFRGKKVRSLRFPKTFEGINHRAANEYLLAESPSSDRIAVFGLPEDIGYTCGVLKHSRCSALKMYWSYVNPPAHLIYEFFRPEILEEAQTLDIPIILHLPRMIVHSLGDLLQLLQDFPRLRVVLAHLGLSKLMVPGLSDAYGAIAANGNVMLDTALNPSREVVSLAISCFGSERIMFGSDEPLNLIRSVAYAHPNRGQRIITEYPYHWVDPDEYRDFAHLAAQATHSHWQAVGAIKEAISELRPSEQEATKRQIFHDNAHTFFGF